MGGGQSRNDRRSRRGDRVIEPAGEPQSVGGAPKTSSPRHTIELRSVSKRYRGTQALAPLDLEIREGEFFCLLGPSRCGKTTTLHLIGGISPATLARGRAQC